MTWHQVELERVKLYGWDQGGRKQWNIRRATLDPSISRGRFSILKVNFWDSFQCKSFYLILGREKISFWKSIFSRPMALSRVLFIFFFHPLHEKRKRWWQKCPGHSTARKLHKIKWTMGEKNIELKYVWVEEEKTELTFPTYVFCSLPMGKIHWAVSDEKGQQKKMTMGLFW